MQRMVGGYDILAHLGSGPSGTVYLGLDRGLDRRVAIKELQPALAADPAFLGRFRRQAQVLARLDNPNCARVHEFLELPTGAYVVSEFVDGANLAQVLEADGPLTAEQALALLKHGLSGLASAHLVGLVHCNIKPTNVLAGREGAPKLTDFGLAVFHAGPGAAGGPALGSPLYMAPEQVRGLPVDGRTDVYSCGALLYGLLTGQPPFQAADPLTAMRMHVTEPVPNPRAANPRLPIEVADLAVRAMAKDPADRHQSAIDFIADLDRAAQRQYGPDWETRGSLGPPVAAAIAVGLASAAIAASSPVAPATVVETAPKAGPEASASTGGHRVDHRAAIGLGLITLLAAAAVGLYAFLNHPPVGPRPIVFAGQRAGESGLYTVQAEGGALGRVPNSTVDDREPSLSPDGRTLLFRGRGGLWTSGVDGSNRRAITRSHPGGADRVPQWSPDGSHLVFLRWGSSRRATGYTISSARPDGSDIRELLDVAETQAEWIRPGWSPDGGRIIFSDLIAGSRDVYVINASGGGLVRFPRLAPTSGDIQPAWSPDGSRVAFISGARSGNVAWVEDADGTNRRQLAPSGELDSWPSWSPDGSKLAFIRSDRATGDNIFVVNADGSNESGLSPRVLPTSVSWATGASGVPSIRGLAPEVTPSVSPPNLGSRRPRWSPHRQNPAPHRHQRCRRRRSRARRRPLSPGGSPAAG